MFIAGPAVSLKGSPTVSPTTAALCGSEPLPPRFPDSMYFLALSQAPPALAMKMARQKPVTRAPARNPPSASILMNPRTRGMATARMPGASISRNDALVEIATHRAESGLTPSRPSRSPGISRNWRRTSSIIFWAARPTASMVNAANRNGSMAPRKRPMNTSTWPTSRDRVPPAWATANSKLLNRARAVSAAEPTANPLATAAVVFPRESRASVTSRTLGSSSAISAIPPALSAIGP